MEKWNLEQRCAIKFCFTLNEKLKHAYGERAVSRAPVFRWLKAFLNGCESVEDQPHSGRPCTSKSDENMTKEKPLMRSDRWLTVRMIGSELNLNHQTIYNILTEELGMWKICAKLVLKNLTNKQKENWRNVCLDLLERIENNENFLKHVITGDESWILEYDPKAKD